MFEDEYVTGWRSVEGQQESWGVDRDPIMQDFIGCENTQFDFQ